MKKEKCLTIVFAVIVMVISSVITALADTKGELIVGDAFSADSGDELLTGDFCISYMFRNEGTVGANFNNFAIEFYSDTVSTGTTGKGYLTLRADAFGWWADGWTVVGGKTPADVNANWTGVGSAFGNDAADGEWQEAMSDAEVIVTAARTGETIKVSFDIKSANGNLYYFTNTVENVYGFGKSLKVHLTGEQVKLSNIVFSPEGNLGPGDNTGSGDGNGGNSNTKKELTVGAAFSSNSGDEILTGDFEIVYGFHNKGTEGANYNNFAIEFYSDKVSAGTTGRGFLTVRADAWGWWADGWGPNGGKTPADVNANWTGVGSTFGNDAADREWQEAMSDAEVIVTAVRKGETISVDYNIKALNGKTYHFSNSVKNVYGYGDTVKVHLTGEKVKLTNITYTVKYNKGPDNNTGDTGTNKGPGSSTGDHTNVKQYIVTFQPKTGAKAVKRKVTAGKKVAPPKRFSRKKYLFAGWYQGKKKYNFSKPVTANITLQAKWKKVTVKQVKLGKVRNEKNSKLSVAIKKITGVHGYQVSYASNKKYKSAKKRITASVKMTLTKLKKGKTYYVRARAYKLDSTGEKIYGKWSKNCKIKISKA